MDPLLSVVIPTYNCKSYLGECLGSVLEQLPKNYELIVVDDGSTDGTVRQLSSYNGKFDNLTIVYCEHKGASGARNTGLKMASGKYITFVDCDDCIRDGFFEDSRELCSCGDVSGCKKVVANTCDKSVHYAPLYRFHCP